MSEKKKNFSAADETGNLPAGTDLYSHLSILCRGLVFISETDSEIVPVMAPASAKVPLETFIRNQFGTPGTKIESGPAADFFRRLTEFHEWQDEDGRRMVRGFRKLEEEMTVNLRDLTMFRAGRVQIDIIVAGCDAEGNIAGIRTRAVET